MFSGGLERILSATQYARLKLENTSKLALQKECVIIKTKLFVSAGSVCNTDRSLSTRWFKYDRDKL
jgi:hypothetical protein